MTPGAASWKLGGPAGITIGFWKVLFSATWAQAPLTDTSPVSILRSGALSSSAAWQASTFWLPLACGVTRNLARCGRLAVLLPPRCHPQMTRCKRQWNRRYLSSRSHQRRPSKERFPWTSPRRWLALGALLLTAGVTITGVSGIAEVVTIGDGQGADGIRPSRFKGVGNCCPGGGCAVSELHR